MNPDYMCGIHRGEGLYENGGFIVHFFDRAKVELLAAQDFKPDVLLCDIGLPDIDGCQVRPDAASGRDSSFDR